MCAQSYSDSIFFVYDPMPPVRVTGASDDAVSCAVMLEVLRSLANLSTPLRHGVVFLFNGAEETLLQVREKLGTVVNTGQVN